MNYSVTLREEPKLRVLEKMVLRKISVFGPERDKVAGDWKQLHNEEFTDLYCQPNVI
jgi:hypothetical protein